MSFFTYPHGTWSSLDEMNYAIAQAAIAEGWDVTSVAAISTLYTEFASWPQPFVPVVSFGISKNGGGSGELLTPSDTGAYTPPGGYSRKDMDSPTQAVQYIPTFMSDILGFKLVAGQVAPLGVQGYYISWLNGDSDDGNGGVKKFYKVTRPPRSLWTSLWYIGVALGIESTPPSYGGYIMTSPPIDGIQVTVWLDNGLDISEVENASKTEFFVTEGILPAVPHPRGIDGHPATASAIQQLMRIEQAFTLYINSQNLWALAEEPLLGQPNWYVINAKPRPGIANAIALIGEQVPCGPRYMNEAPVWWLIFDNTLYLRPSSNLVAQVGRLYANGDDNKQLRWDGNIIECLEAFLFFRNISLNTYDLAGLLKDVLVGHGAYLSSFNIDFDGDSFRVLSNGTAAGLLVRR